MSCGLSCRGVVLLGENRPIPPGPHADGATHPITTTLLQATAAAALSTSGEKPHCTQAEMQDMRAFLREQDHAMNSELSPLDVSGPSARRWNLGPYREEAPASRRLKTGASWSLLLNYFVRTNPSVSSSIPHARDELRLRLVAVKEFIEVSDPTETAALQLLREPRSKADRLKQYSPIWCGLMAST